MKLVKMSLATAVLLGASAFAIDNVKVNGDAKVLYSTNDKDVANAGNLFDQENSIADTGLRLGVTGDLLKGVSFGVTGYAVSTLGLENNLVANVWTGAHGTTTNANGTQVDDQAWIGELWIAGSMGKTTVKVGRMEIDSPLVFSEKWSVVPNTFEGAVAINTDLPDTTLVGAWIGKGNGANALGYNSRGLGGVDNNSSGIGLDGGVVGAGANFNTFVGNGAYAVAAINNSFKPLVAQAWYYNVSSVADAFWLQGDIDCSLVKGVKIGAQYGKMDPKGLLAAVNDSEAYAFKLGYEGIENLKLSAAYSDVDNDGTLKMSNVATNNLGRAQSKLYTEAAWGQNFGYVSAPGAESWNAKASYDMKDIAKFCASYTNVDNNKPASNLNLDEVALSASKSFGPLDTRIQYVSTDADDVNSAKRFDTLNVFVTLNF